MLSKKRIERTAKKLKREHNRQSKLVKKKRVESLKDSDNDLMNVEIINGVQWTTFITNENGVKYAIVYKETESHTKKAKKDREINKRKKV